MTPTVHVYRLNPLRLALVPLVWLGFIVALGASALWADDSAAAGAALGAAAVLTLIVGPIFYFTVWKSRLELSATGITHFQFGYTIRSSWENLASLSMVPGREGLYLRQPGVDSALLRGSTRLLESATRAVGLPSMIGDEDALAEGRFIALMPFTHHLRSGQLRRDLERWAPQLFTAAAA